MGFRFRKSIKIAPGVKLNLGKKSASISVGGKGVRRTISTTGRQTTSVGIPGSGIYYTDSSSMKKSKQPTSRSTNNSYNNPTLEVDNFNTAIDNITSLHKHCDYSYDWSEINNRPSPINSENKGINEIEATAKYNSYVPGFFANIFSSLRSKHTVALYENIVIARKKDREVYDEWKNLKEVSRLVLKGDLSIYEKVVKESSFIKELSEFTDSLAIKLLDNDSISIEFDINVYKVIPDTYKTITNAGNLSIRKYTKTNFYQLAQQFISSLSLHICKNILSILPLETVLLNIQVHELNTQTGNMDRYTILSVNIDRNTLETLNMSSIIPFDALGNFKHNVRFLKTKGFQPVDKIG